MSTEAIVVDVTTAAAPVPVLLLMGRSYRKTLIIASAVNGTTFVSTSQGDFNAKTFARVSAGTTLVLPYRDFGPLITGEIWINTTIGNSLVNGSEIFDVGKVVK